jgi:hypothetical protein
MDLTAGLPEGLAPPVEVALARAVTKMPRGDPANGALLFEDSGRPAAAASPVGTSTVTERVDKYAESSRTAPDRHREPDT